MVETSWMWLHPVLHPQQLLCSQIPEELLGCISIHTLYTVQYTAGYCILHCTTVYYSVVCSILQCALTVPGQCPELLTEVCKSRLQLTIGSDYLLDQIYDHKAQVWWGNVCVWTGIHPTTLLLSVVSCSEFLQNIRQYAAVKNKIWALILKLIKPEGCHSKCVTLY